MEAHSEHVLTLANSIIGVSILAMPYCFKQCGILLAVLILMVSNLISRLSCHFLIKSAIIARRRTFEYLAYYIFGSFGKLAIEVGMIGFLFGTCVAYFVVMGDLGPEIISEISGQETTNTMRSTILLVLAIFCVLPLGLLKNIDSLSGVSKATIGFYIGLVMKITIDALPHIFYGDWISKVEFWRPEGIIQCLPIFSMALSCQTQLFEIYQVVHNPSLEKMNHVIKNAINMCTLVYFLVGFFGYIAFANKNFTGNILLSFTPSLLTNIIKLGFILSVAFSFPLVIFPCRVSVHSLIYRQGISIHEGFNDYIPEGRFKVLTLIIVLISLIIGILIPNIEFVLGLVGSSIGIMVCVLFPVICFIHISQKNTNERLLAKLILIVGLIIMILGTYENLLNIEKIQSPVVSNLVTEKRQLINILPADLVGSNREPLENQIVAKQSPNQTKVESLAKITDSPEIRHEPPQPVELPDSQSDLKRKKVVEKERNGNLNVIIESKEKIDENDIRKDKISENESGQLDNQENSVIAKNKHAIDDHNKINSIEQPGKHPSNPDKSKNDIVDIEAIKKDDKEILLQEKQVRDSHLQEHQILIDKIQKQNEVQEELVKQQKKLIEAFEKQQEQKVNDEKLKAEIKAVKEIESIALKAIEKISGDAKQNDQIVAELEKDVLQKVNAKEKAEEDTSRNNKSEENVEIKELKLMNNLLSAKIKQNNMTHKPINEVYEEPSKNLNQDIKPLDTDVIPNASFNKTANWTENKTNTHNNNTAPLLLNLGQVVNKTGFDPIKDRLPLPMVVSYLQQQNTNSSDSKGLSLSLTKAFNNSSNIKNTEHLENKNPVSAEDVKVMRRDILAYAAMRRKR